jgi:hypothetical protein
MSPRSAMCSFNCTAQEALRTSGKALADIGYADSIGVGKAAASGVTTAVMRDDGEPFGKGVDGLLGMSFLSRFNVRLSPTEVEMTATPFQWVPFGTGMLWIVRRLPQARRKFRCSSAFAGRRASDDLRCAPVVVLLAAASLRKAGLPIASPRRRAWARCVNAETIAAYRSR